MSKLGEATSSPGRFPLTLGGRCLIHETSVECERVSLPGIAALLLLHVPSKCLPEVKVTRGIF